MKLKTFKQQKPAHGYSHHRAASWKFLTKDRPEIVCRVQPYTDIRRTNRGLSTAPEPGPHKLLHVVKGKENRPEWTEWMVENHADWLRNGPFIVPSRWRGRLPKGFPEWIMPRHMQKMADIHGDAETGDIFGPLWAYLVNYPGAKWPDVRRALEFLMRSPAFWVWARNVNMAHLATSRGFPLEFKQIWRQQVAIYRAEAWPMLFHQVDQITNAYGWVEPLDPSQPIGPGRREVLEAVAKAPARPFNPDRSAFRTFDRWVVCSVKYWENEENSRHWRRYDRTLYPKL